MRSKTEIKEELHSLSKKIVELNSESYKLREELDEQNRNFLKPLIKKCYKNEKTAFIVTNVPQTEYYITGSHTNFYQIPVYLIYTKGDNFGECEFTTVYSKAVDADDPLECFREDYEEISIEDFISITTQTIRTALNNIGGE